MAAKIILFAFIATVVSAAITDNCPCDPPSDLEASEIWDFFKKLWAQEGDDSIDDKNLRAVLPGELSPLLDCYCPENNRRKRKVLPEVTDEVPETPETPETPESPVSDSVGDSIPVGVRSPKCPQGYVWFGILCVDETLVLEK